MLLEILKDYFLLATGVALGAVMTGLCGAAATARREIEEQGEQ
ncbi:MAG: hypothetical protein P4N41_16230 [Negativicutes bacterium]|nr:hypothetical protein [Negativicutes bacterium]MDR3591201.1 hypothetical protein [Negativicutes bacterium]